MIDLVRLASQHLRALRLQDNQAHFGALFTDEFIEALTRTNAWTLLRHGEPVGCAGVAEIDGFDNYAWAFLGESIGRQMLTATRACDDMLSGYRSDVFTHCRMDVPANARWLKLLGFEPTGTRDVLPDGMTYDLWVRRHDR